MAAIVHITLHNQDQSMLNADDNFFIGMIAPELKYSLLKQVIFNI